MAHETQLSRFSLFNGINLDETKAISRITAGGVQSFHDGQVIRTVDDPDQSLFAILEGSVQGVMEDTQGHVFVVESFHEPELIALANLFAPAEKFPVSLVSHGRSRLLRIDQQRMRQIFSLSQRVQQNFMEILSQRVLHLSHRLWECQFFSIEQKIFHLVWRTYQHRKSLEFDLPHTHEKLAHQFGVSRPSLSRALVKINREGILLFRDRRVRILNLEQFLAKGRSNPDFRISSKISEFERR